MDNIFGGLFEIQVAEVKISELIDVGNPLFWKKRFENPKFLLPLNIQSWCFFF